MKRIEQLLRSRIGLNVTALGPSVMERTVRQRMSVLRLDQAEDYAALLAASSEEWDEFVEAVVVGETWFFRDRHPFVALTRLARDHSSPLPLRLLSVPCASGEEPYSMVMALLDAGLPLGRFLVDAVDISSHALAQARRAWYGSNSFRGSDLGFRDRHFRAVKDRYVLNAEIRDHVHFQRGNLLDADVPAGTTTYDFVFCRNLLIYLDPAAQRRVLAKLERCLSDLGLLFVAPAEQTLAVNHGFVSANLPLAYACRKASPVRRFKAAAARVHSDAPAPTLPAISPDFGPRHATPATTHRATADERDGPLQLAHQLADAGRLQEATLMCQYHLERESDSAQAYYLLGLIADAQGLASAAEFYRRALYLDPHHGEALRQMSLLCAKQGDHHRARVFSRRAARVQERG